MNSLLDDIALVAFDLDGTLIDSVPDLAVAVDAMLDDLALPRVGEARVRDWVGNGSRKLVERALTHACNEALSEALVERGHEAFLVRYAQAPCERTRVYPGVRETLETLGQKGIPLVVITNKPHDFVAPILSALGLAGHFALTLGGDSLPRKKPDPMALLHVAKRFDVPVTRCLMVGDSRHDIEAGRRAGFRTLAVPYGYNHGEPVSASRPDAVVESLAELL